MYGAGIYTIGAAGLGDSIVIDGNRAVYFIENGQTVGGAAMTLNAFLTAVIFATKPPLVTMTGGTVLEKGETSLATTLAITVTKQDTTADIASVVVTSPGYDSGDIKTGTGNQSINHPITLTTDTNEVFTVTVTTVDGKTATTTTTFYFRNRIWYGKGAVPGGGYNNTWIHALAGSALDADYETSFNVNAGSGEYIFFAIPKDYATGALLDPPYFFLGTSVPGGMGIADDTVSYTYGTNTEDYIVYKSAQANLGDTDVVVSDEPTG